MVTVVYLEKLMYWVINAFIPMSTPLPKQGWPRDLSLLTLPLWSY